MKKLLYLIVALVGISFAACDTKNDIIETPTIDKGKILPDQLVRIEAAKDVKLRSTEAQYTEDGELLPTALEVAKNGVYLHGMFYFVRYGQTQFDYHVSERMFAETQRDTISEIPALLMFSDDILNEREGLDPSFLKGYDVLVLDEKRDTIAYIPNQQLREAEEKIRAAYADSNYNEIYRLFREEAYKFKPTTGKQYRKLKEQGLQ